MLIFGPPPMSAAELAARIVSGADFAWDWGQRPIKNFLYDLGKDFSVSCRRKGLPEHPDVHEWLLDLVWLDKETGDMRLAVESEWSFTMEHRLDDFQKLMPMKSPLKLFIFTTRSPDEGLNVCKALEAYLQPYSQHVEGEEYLLMEVRNNQPYFYHYIVPNSGRVPDATFSSLPA